MEEKGKEEAEINLGGVLPAPVVVAAPAPVGGGIPPAPVGVAISPVKRGPFRSIPNKNALFGINVERTSKARIVVPPIKANNAAINDYVMRETGLEKQLQRSLRLGAALDAPKVYLTDKAKDLDAIGARLSAYFAAEYSRLLQTGITDEKAKAKATAYMNVQKEREMAIHNANWPTEINDKVVQKLLRTTAI